MDAMSRREFFRKTGADAALAGLLATAAATLRANPLGLPIGSQTYPHRALIKEGNFAGLAATLAGIGVKTLELCSPLGYTEFTSLSDARMVKEIMNDHGLTCESAHFSMKELREKQPAAIDWAKEVGITQMITATLGGGNAPTLDDVKRAADEYNKIAAVAAASGIQQGLHNEGFESSEVDGRRTYDILFELLDPKLVKFQFQMSTISRGFVAHEYLDKYPGRFISMHLQDVDLNCHAATATRRAARPASRRAWARRADRPWQGQHRLDQDVPGGKDGRREELLRRAEHGSDEGKRRVPEDADGMTHRGLTLLVALCLTAHVEAQPTPPVHVVLWFDAEDYILPEDDDATKRLAEMLTRLGVKATFKVVGEKARVLEQRGRTDVIAALKRHEIGYHSNTHSQQPTIAVYLQHAGWDDGRAEFERREGQGSRDVARIFGTTPVAYGQPGSALGAAELSGAARDGHPDVSGRSRPRRHRRPAVLLRRDAQRLQDAIDTRADGARRRRSRREHGAIHETRRRAARAGRRHDQHLLSPVGVGSRRVLGRGQLQPRRKPAARRWKRPRTRPAAETETAFADFEQYIRFIQTAARRGVCHGVGPDASVRRPRDGACVLARRPARDRCRGAARDHIPAASGRDPVGRRRLRPAHRRNGGVRQVERRAGGVARDAACSDRPGRLRRRSVGRRHQCFPGRHSHAPSPTRRTSAARIIACPTRSGSAPTACRPPTSLPRSRPSSSA